MSKPPIKETRYMNKASGRIYEFIVAPANGPKPPASAGFVYVKDVNTEVPAWVKLDYLIRMF